MPRHGLKSRVFILTLTPTLIIGLLLSLFFTFHRYNELENQLIESGGNISEPLAIASKIALHQNNRELVRQLISYTHRQHSNITSIVVFDIKHELFATSSFHPNFESLRFDPQHPIPMTTQTKIVNTTLIIQTPIIAEHSYFFLHKTSKETPVIGYIAIEIDLSSLRLQQYQEMLTALMILGVGLLLSVIFAYVLMHTITSPISKMIDIVDTIRRGQLSARIKGNMPGELNTLKNGINQMAISLSEYHIEMQNSIDQATSDLRETLEQLEIQNIELDIAKRHAQDATKVKSEFLANMSHELRTPLNGVLGFARQMLKTELSENQVDYLKTIERSANNLLNIINDILDFSKLEAEKLTLESISFELRNCVEEVITLQAPSAHEKGLELTLNIDPNIPHSVIGDSFRIQQVLTNLVGNAIKFTESGNVDVNIEQQQLHDRYVDIKFIIRDTGIGISEGQQSILFQAFKQSDTSISRRYGGTGLGLVITQKLVEKMDSKLNLNSHLHQGSSFWFTLRLETDMASIPLYDYDLNGRKLMLIEPNIDASYALQVMLSVTHAQVTPYTVLPTPVLKQDLIIYSIPTNAPLNRVELTKLFLELAKISNKLIIGLPTTELYFAEELSKYPQLTTISKPLTQQKLFTALLDDSEPKPSVIEETPETKQLPLKVMAVDDNLANLKLIDTLLQEYVTEVITCDNGNDAVSQAQEQQFDVILMDIQMPNMDGITACQHIKQTNLNSNTPIIAVTAHAMKGERERLLKAGMDDYLTKPIDELALQQIVHSWGSSDKKPTALIIPQAPLTIDNGQVIDWQQALRQAANKEDLAKEMLQMLVDSLDDVELSIEQTVNQNQDLATLLEVVHKLHGSCAYSGVPRLKTACASLETLLRTEITLNEIEPELYELQDEIDKVKAESPNYLD